MTELTEVKLWANIAPRMRSCRTIFYARAAWVHSVGVVTIYVHLARTRASAIARLAPTLKTNRKSRHLVTLLSTNIILGN